jgi:hypothetical protein
MAGRYYLIDAATAAVDLKAARTIYGPDGMPTITVELQAGKWTADRQALLETILAAVNGTSPATA